MNTNNPLNKVADDLVITMEYTLKVDGEIVDQAGAEDPIEFLQGQNQIISGLEKALYGMAVGETKTITVPPEEGYGAVDPEALMEVSRADFPADIPLELGTELTLAGGEDEEDEEYEELDARIVKIDGDTITLDLNHPMAGKTLVFDVKIAGIREATPEELEHGHVHGAEGFEYDEWEEDEEEDK